MSQLKRLAVLIAILALIAGLAACERTITNTEVVQSPANCFSCHSDNNTFLVAADQQWQNSQHASGANVDRNGPPCSGCHTSEGWIERVESGSATSTIDNPTVIHCFTCHAPHSTGGFGLRFANDVVLQNGATADLGNGNLCGSCHQARRNVDTYVDIGTVTFTSSHWGPHHSVQADMLMGENGYEYDGYTYDDLTFHRALAAPVDGEADACLNCHFKVTSNNAVGGHTFMMESTVREPGQEGGEDVNNVAACRGCHPGLQNFNYKTIQDSVEVLIDDLRQELLTAGLIDTDDHTVEDRVTSADSAGAVWNFLMAYEDQSHGVHNSKYIIGLLQSAIDFMQGNLPQPSSPPAEARKPESMAGK